MEFKNIVLKAKPNRNLSIILSVKILESRCCEDSSEDAVLKQAFSITKRVMLFSRPCQPGEIITVDLQCQQCPTGTFSMSDPMEVYLKYPSLLQKCLMCPENARCERDLVIPNKGYWKASRQSTLILK